jgi:hypothetical protein
MRRLRNISINVRCAAFLALLVCLFSVPAAAQPWAGSGDVNNPYQIWDACDMQAIGADANYWDAHFKLMADIDLGSYTGTSFNIIGGYGNPFTGVFDGKGHNISNFTCDSTGVNYIGLFGYISDPNAELKNLYLVDPNVKGGTGYFVGSLAGHLGWCTMTGCHVEGGGVSGNSYVGGLVGENGSDIFRCSCSAAVSGSDNVGGLAGLSGGIISNCKSSSIVSGLGNYIGGVVGENSGNIFDSNSIGSVNGNNYVGGLVGENYEGISNCYATGSVDGNEKVGGLVGINTRFVPSSVSDSYSTCTVTGTYNEVGGLVGRNEGYISNCYATGVSSGEFYIGGLVGRNYDGEVLNCYATGSVMGFEPYHTGGLIGDAYKGTVRNSFWDVNSTGLDNSYGGIGKTTSDMQTANTFVSWSCAGLWTINEGNDYPHLIWENAPGELLSDIQWYDAGNGTQADPYLIYTAEQLNRIGLIECDWAGYFELGADVDLSNYTGDTFNIIGYIRGGGDYKAFNGVFNGNGHTISNFTYNSTGKSYIGIFGFVGDPNAQIRNLGLTNPDINHSSGYCVGSLVGYFAYGTICECYVERGSVVGDSTVGGLVGYSNSANILNCHSSADVSGNGRIGGLAGSVWMGSFTNCYAAGEVNGISDTGALVGYDDTGSYSNCFWDVNVNPDVNGIGNANDPNVIGLTTAEMQTRSTFTGAGWDFVGEVINGPNDIWDICEGTNYPKFVWQIPAADFVCPDGVTLVDFSVLGLAWYSDPNQPNWNPICDISEPNDNFIDELDLDVFCENWLAGVQ